MTGKFINLNASSFIYFLIALLLISCGKADMNDPVENPAIPLQVEVTNIVNSYGKTVIHYKRPNDNNLKYIKAIYEPRSGVQREVNASYFVDSLVLNGFEEAKSYDVKLYSMSYAEVQSEPIEISVTPLEPPYKSIRNSMSVESTFGGIKIELQNPTNAEIAVGILKMNEQDQMQEIGVIYSSLENLCYSVRGQDAIESTFGVFIRDRWGQLSDTLKTTLIPIEEVMCDKALFTNMKFPGDTYECHSWGGSSTKNKLELCWNDKINEETPAFHTKASDPMPQHFTIDLGKKYTLSRFELFPRGKKGDSKYTWQKGWPKIVEIWGSNSPESSELDPNFETAYWNSWKLIERHDVVRPSGATDPGNIVPMTDDDKRTVNAGYEIELPENTSYRYIRIRTLETWGGTQWIMLSELSFYGIEAID